MLARSIVRRASHVAFATVTLLAAESVAAQSPVQQTAQDAQAQLTADSAKLLQLATELKAEVDKSTKDQLSLAVIKKADEVEKLARKVREEMKLNPAGSSNK